MDEPHLASAEFGGFWIRFFAVLVDSAILFLVMVLLIVGGGSALGEEGLTYGALAAWLFAFLYWPVMHASKLQATLGKALLGLRVTGYQGNRLSFLRSLGRELAKILSGAVAMVGYLVAAFTARKQALHDLVASTYVIREGKARVVLALATMVAAFLLPVVVALMGVGGPMVDSLMAMAKSMEQQAAPPPVMKAPPRPAVVAAVKPPPAPPPALPVVKSAPEVAKAAPVVETPPAPKPVAVAMVTPAPSPVAQPKPVEPKRVEAKRVEAKPVAEKKAAPKKAAAKAAPAQPRPSVAKAPAVFEPKGPRGPKFNDLVTAVLYRDAEAVSELLRFGRWADKPDSRGTTPLMLAAELGDAGSAEALLKGGADASRAVPVAQARRDGAMLDLLKRYAAR